MKNAIELLQAELSAALALNAKLSARIEALEKAGNYQAVNESPISRAEYAALSYRDSGYGLGDDDRAEMEIIDADEQERIEIELSAGEWLPDIQWHKDNGYDLPQSPHEKAIAAHGHWVPNNSWHRQNGI